jgi:16S rRNA (adenine1518-N6/adenine1519-N6)-dimethyltransferase
MFQKELGEKITGKFPSVNYGRLSILANYKLNLIKKFQVSPNCFLPKPKVTSLVIHFQPKKKFTFNIKNLISLEKITNILFSNKRKMINKNIKKLFTDEEIKIIKDINLNYRPSEIKPEIYYKITELFEKK